LNTLLTIFRFDKKPISDTIDKNHPSFAIPRHFLQFFIHFCEAALIVLQNLLTFFGKSNKLKKKAGAEKWTEAMLP
jgi:hypothetical protein